MLSDYFRHAEKIILPARGILERFFLIERFAPGVLAKNVPEAF
jgi:hypothetical protein